MRATIAAALLALAICAPAVAQNTLAATPSTLNFVLDPDDEIFQGLSISSSGAPLAFTISSSPGWLSVQTSATAATISGVGVTVSVITKDLAVGSYKGTITATSTANTVDVPVTLTVTDGPALQIDAICNAASYACGAVSPGEVVTLFGSFEITTNLLELDYTGKVATDLDGIQVLVKGVNSSTNLPQTFSSPLVYTSPTGISAVVPYGFNPGTVSFAVTSNGGAQASNVASQNVQPAVPGIFTANASGAGQGAILNQDYSVNSTANPAAIGSTVVLYATGEGNTSPAGISGAVTQVRATAPITPVPLGAVQVFIDNQPAAVTFAGEAPGIVSGVMQVNAQIPAQARTGSVPVQISVGGVLSQSSVTVAVK